MTRLEIVPYFLLSFLMFIPACNPEYSLCVVTTSCLTGMPVARAHVRIAAYDTDGNANPLGKLCHQELNFPKPFVSDVDAPGFAAKAERPFQLGGSGTTDFQATICLDP